MKLQPVRRKLHIDYHLKVGTRLGLKKLRRVSQHMPKRPRQKRGQTLSISSGYKGHARWITLLEFPGSSA